MKYWKKDTGFKFNNSDKCFGYEYNPGSGTINIAKICIRSRYPEKGWSYLEDIHEMAVVIKGSGYIETKEGERQELQVGDVVYFGPGERVCWGGNMDLIVPCGPAFDPDKHFVEEAR